MKSQVLVGRRSILSLACSTLVVFAVLGVSQAQAHEEEVITVGRNSADQLVAETHFDQPVELPVSIFPGIPGYATGELALHSTILDEPDEDFFQLSPGADLRFTLLAKDPGVEVWNGTGFMGIGDSYFIGTAPFDSHPIWNIVSGTPGNTYSLTLKLRDVNGVYSESDPLVLSFTPVQVLYEIKIALVDPQQATLTWPTNAFDWTLESAASLSVAEWNTVTNLPAISGTNFSLSVTTSLDSQRFFRLHKQ